MADDKPKALKKIVWDTKKVGDIKEKLEDGAVIKASESPYHENTIGIRKAGLVFAMSQDEISEYIKCAVDVMYFAQNYCYTKSEDGSHKIIKLREYQKEILKMFKENRFNILMSSRQSGKTICSSIFVLHFMLFNNTKNVLITANQWETNYDIIDKIKEIYMALPFFLQKGVKVWNKKSIGLENKSKIRTAIVSKASGVGANVDLWLGDEYAIPEGAILERFHAAVYPTISSMTNSKIILISTPRGYNLFHKLLTDAERPEGDPKKNNFKAMRVYWWAVPSRFCTYIRLNQQKMYDLKIETSDIFDYLIEKYPNNKIELEYSKELKKDIIYVYNNEHCKEEDINTEMYNDRFIYEFAEITTWKKEAIKDIGSLDAFNQEFSLMFVTANHSLLDEKLIEELNNNKKDYTHEAIDIFNHKLRFNWSNLTWCSDKEIYDSSNRKNYKIIISIDLAEGLGNDYTVLNIFKVRPKTIANIDLYKNSYKKISDFFCLEQIGMFRSNIVSVNQVAELLYCLVYDYFNEENVKVVLEMNYGGPELLAYIKNVFDGNNDYGSSIFVRYKHRIDAVKEDIGLKVTGNKNLMIKDYQDAMQRRDVLINNEDNIRELTTFVKNETAAGNVRYACDNGNDDTVMSLVNCITILRKIFYQDICDEMFEKLDKDFQNHVNTILNTLSFKQGTDYSGFLNIKNNNIR